MRHALVSTADGTSSAWTEMEAYLHITPAGIGPAVVRGWLGGIQLKLRLNALCSRVHRLWDLLGLVPSTEIEAYLRIQLVRQMCEGGLMEFD